MLGSLSPESRTEAADPAQPGLMQESHLLILKHQPEGNSSNLTHIQEPAGKCSGKGGWQALNLSAIFVSPPPHPQILGLFPCPLQGPSLPSLVSCSRAAVSPRGDILHVSVPQFLSGAPIFVAATQGTTLDYLALKVRRSFTLESPETETINKTVLGRLAPPLHRHQTETHPQSF